RRVQARRAPRGRDHARLHRHAERGRPRPRDPRPHAYARRRGRGRSRRSRRGLRACQPGSDLMWSGPAPIAPVGAARRSAPVAAWACAEGMGAGPDHISVYSLIVEPGTRLAARVRRGELAAPDDDLMADRHAIAEEVLAAAGYECYELCSWARDAAARCRHNV